VAIRLASMLVAGSLPFAVFLFTRENDNGHYASPNALSVFGGCWAMFAISIVLYKGMDGMFTKETGDIAWSFISLTNLVGVVFFFFSYMNP
jgi:hypothetical protein